MQRAEMWIHGGGRSQGRWAAVKPLTLETTFKLCLYPATTAWNHKYSGPCIALSLISVCRLSFYGLHALWLSHTKDCSHISLTLLSIQVHCAWEISQKFGAFFSFYGNLPSSQLCKVIEWSLTHCWRWKPIDNCSFWLIPRWQLWEESLILTWDNCLK